MSLQNHKIKRKIHTSMITWKKEASYIGIRSRLHQAPALTQSPYCYDTKDTSLIENNGPK